MTDNEAPFGFRDPGHPRRRRPRPGHRRALDADLPDDLLRLRRRRSRRLPLQPPDLRLHLLPPDQPDRLRAGGTGGGARSRQGRHGDGVRPCRTDAGALPAHAAGLAPPGVEQALWRLRHPVHAHLRQIRLAGLADRLRRPRRCARGDPARDARPVLRVARQSGRHRQRHGGARGHRARGRHPADGGQHHGNALPLPPVRVGRGPHRAFHDQVPLRPRQRHGRHGGGQRRLRLGAERQVPLHDGAGRRLSRPALLGDLRRPRLHRALPRRRPARPRRDHGPAQRLPGDHRHRDAAAAHGPAQRERAGSGALPLRPSRGRLGLLCGAGRQPLQAARRQVSEAAPAAPCSPSASRAATRRA